MSSPLSLRNLWDGTQYGVPFVVLVPNLGPVDRGLGLDKHG